MVPLYLNWHCTFLVYCQCEPLVTTKISSALTPYNYSNVANRSAFLLLCIVVYDVHACSINYNYIVSLMWCDMHGFMVTQLMCVIVYTAHARCWLAIVNCHLLATFHTCSNPYTETSLTSVRLLMPLAMFLLSLKSIRVL